MRDLRVVTVSEDGTQLLLSDEAGEQFTLPVDESLRSSLRRQPVRPVHAGLPTSSTPSPREIQASVRGGADPAHIADSFGLPMDKVLRFAAPVLDERAHVARTARTVLLRDEGMLELGTLDDVVSRALDGRAAVDTLSWDAWRREDGRWIVACRWLEEEQRQAALWLLDASGGSATPVDEAARDVAGLTVRRVDRQPVTGPTRLAVVPDQPTLTDEPDEPGEANDAVSEDDTPTGPLPTMGSDDGQLRLSDIAPRTTREVASSPRPVREVSGRQRPAVPSWDEIMFGRRT